MVNELILIHAQTKHGELAIPDELPRLTVRLHARPPEAIAEVIESRHRKVPRTNRHVILHIIELTVWTTNGCVESATVGLN